MLLFSPEQIEALTVQALHYSEKAGLFRATLREVDPHAAAAADDAAAPGQPPVHSNL